MLLKSLNQLLLVKIDQVLELSCGTVKLYEFVVELHTPLAVIGDRRRLPPHSLHRLASPGPRMDA